MTSPSPGTLRELLAAVHGDNERPFLLNVDGEVMHTYSDAACRSAQLAHALAARGAAPGERVAMQVAKSAEAIMVYLACRACRVRPPPDQHRLHGRRGGVSRG